MGREGRIRTRKEWRTAAKPVGRALQVEVERKVHPSDSHRDIGIESRHVLRRLRVTTELREKKLGSMGHEWGKNRCALGIAVLLVASKQEIHGEKK